MFKLKCVVPNGLLPYRETERRPGKSSRKSPLSNDVDHHGHQDTRARQYKGPGEYPSNPVGRMNTSCTQAHTEAERIAMIDATITKTRYRVRQTFFSFGSDCEETFETAGEAAAYGHAIAEDLAQTFFQASEDYADIPLTSPFNAIGYPNETDFFARLCEDFSISSDEDGCGRNFGVCQKIRWSELVDRIGKAAITIEPFDGNAKHG